MKINFFGAAQNVTGSKHLVEAGGLRILLDCGLHQGRRREAYELNKTMPFAAASIDAVILSHAHADHCGLLPMLVKQGYKQKIYATQATIDIARLIMLDSAKIQLEDFERLSRYDNPGNEPLPPLYSIEDVEETCQHFAALDYGVWQDLNDECRFKFYDAGHILGSAATVLEEKITQGTKRLLFTGDLGNTHVPILPEPAPIEEPIDAIISECTYGDRFHKSVDEANDFLIKLINDAVKYKTKIIMPAFALGRTQEVIYILHKLFDQKKIPAIPVAIDSPLGNSVTDVFKKYTDSFDEETAKDFPNHESPFMFKNMKQVTSVDDSRALERARGPIIIIASSGMCEGGRILHHLEDSVGDPSAVIVLTGYQAEYTLGRKLLEGVSPVRIYNKLHQVKARVVTLNEFSAHADQKGLKRYIEALKGLKQVFLVHGEERQAAIFKTALAADRPDLLITVPAPKQSWEV
jgi:metallo-beta-lactamase family protein